MLPTVRQLEAFVSVFQLGSVTRAAARMNLTQSTVSVLLKQLEQGLGAPLFDRTTRVMSPTETARQILPFAERAIRELELMKRTTESLVSVTSGRVRLAASAAVSASFLPGVIGRFADRHPAVEIELHDGAPSTLNKALLDGAVDFAIGGWPDAISPELRYDRVTAGYLVAARRRTSVPLPPTLGWRELGDEPAVISVREGSMIRRRIQAELARRDTAFRPTLECELLSTIIALTVEGLGVAVIPDNLIGGHHLEALTIQRLVEPEVPHEIVAITRPDVSLAPAARAFLDELGGAFSTHPRR